MKSSIDKQKESINASIWQVQQHIESENYELAIKRAQDILRSLQVIQNQKEFEQTLLSLDPLDVLSAIEIMEVQGHDKVLS